MQRKWRMEKRMLEEERGMIHCRDRQDILNNAGYLSIFYCSTTYLCLCLSESMITYHILSHITLWRQIMKGIKKEEEGQSGQIEGLKGLCPCLQLSPSSAATVRWEQAAGLWVKVISGAERWTEEAREGECTEKRMSSLTTHLASCTFLTLS